MPMQLFNFRVGPDERRLIAGLARRLERGEADAMRFIVRQAARELGITAADVPLSSIPGKRGRPRKKAA